MRRQGGGLIVGATSGRPAWRPDGRARRLRGKKDFSPKPKRQQPQNPLLKHVGVLASEIASATNGSVRAFTIAWLIVERDYPPNRLRTEVTVPRREPSDFADVVVYQDDDCTIPYLVVENKAPGQTEGRRDQGIEQGFGKGKAPPEWRAMYFEDSSSTWYRVQQRDVVYSSIDLWKGCIAVVPETLDGALVTKEFPTYEVLDERIDPEFLSVLFRSRYYQRGFRAITTGHSNRRRTQQGDFENLEIAFPPDRNAQRALIQPILEAVRNRAEASNAWEDSRREFDHLVDGLEPGEVPDEVRDNIEMDMDE